MSLKKKFSWSNLLKKSDSLLPEFSMDESSHYNSDDDMRTDWSNEGADWDNEEDYEIRSIEEMIESKNLTPEQLDLLVLRIQELRDDMADARDSAPMGGAAPAPTDSASTAPANDLMAPVSKMYPKLMKNSKYFFAIMKKLAAWEEKDRKALYEEFSGLLGGDYAKDMVKDYIPKGKAVNVDKPKSSGQVEAKFKSNVKTAAKKDRDLVKNYYDSLLGDDFSNKLVEYYKNTGKLKDKKTSGQTKTAKKTNPWAVCNKTVGKKNDPEKFERCVQDVKKTNKSKKK